MVRILPSSITGMTYRSKNNKSPLSCTHSFGTFRVGHFYYYQKKLYKLIHISQGQHLLGKISQVSTHQSRTVHLKSLKNSFMAHGITKKKPASKSSTTSSTSSTTSTNSSTTSTNSSKTIVSCLRQKSEQRIHQLITTTSFPDYWPSEVINKYPSSLDATQHLIPVLNSSPQHELIIKLLDQSIDENQYQVEFFQVINPIHFLNYQHWCDVLRLKYPDLDDLIERYAFHGTTSSAVASIVKYGFKYKYSSRYLYGKGIYFAKSPRYSLSDEYAVPNHKKEKFMFISRVCVGREKCGYRDLQDVDDTFQSASDHHLPEYSSIIVTFNDYQSYPEFLVVLKEK